MGGKARAEKLTAAERSDIARYAAAAKWDKDGKLPCPRATHGSPDRPLVIGNLQIPCFVLNDGRRVITQGGMRTALEMSPGTATKGGGDRIRNFLSTKALKDFVPDSLREMIIDPIRFKTPGGAIAYGYEATILPDVCDAVLTARLEKRLNYQQEHIAKQCEILVRAFAKVGIIALVDEATGYQEIRDRAALQEILKHYISADLLKWVKTFPIEFYKEIFRLNGWPWNSGKMPGVIGKWTNDIVYQRIAPGVLDELKKLNPPDDKGNRKYRFHQFLTRELGHPALQRRLYELVGMASSLSDLGRINFTQP